MELTIGRAGVEVRGRTGATRLDPDDPGALLPHLGAAVELEEGLTGAGLFAALMPWSASLSAMAGLDMAEWGRALARSHLRDASEPPPRGEGMSAVVISPEVEFVDAHGHDEMRVDWATTARSASDPGVSYALPADVSAWGRLPVEMTGAATVRGGYEGSRKVVVTPTLYDAVVLGFLGDISFDGSPDEAVEVEDAIASLAAGMRADLRGDD